MHWLRCGTVSPKALALWAGDEVSLVLLSAACDDHVLLLLCFSLESQGLEVAKKFTWASSLHLTIFGQYQLSSWFLEPWAQK